MGVFKEIPKSDGTTTLFYRLDGDRNTVEVGSTYGLGTIDYEGALNKPSINGVTLVGDKTAEDLGLQRAGAIPDGIVLEENLGSGFEIDDDGTITVAGDFENILEVKSGEEIMNAPADYNGTVICSSSYGSAERGNIYIIENGKIVETLISVSESGGIVVNTNNSETISPLELNVALGTEVKLQFNYKSLTNGKGVAKLYMNNVLKGTKSILMGPNEFDITEYVQTGINVFSVEITDSNNFTVILDYLVNGVNLTLKSNFNANMVYSGNKVEYRYVVVGAGVKKVHFIIDGEEIGTQVVRTTGEESVYNLSKLKHGAQVFEVYAETTVSDVTILSNVLTYKLLYAVDGETTPIISSNFTQSSCIQGELLNIDYIVYNPLETITDAYLQIIGTEETLEPTSIKVDRSLHYWGVNQYPLGDIKFVIGCGEEKLEIPITVKELEIDIEPQTDGLELYLTSTNRSNSELEDTRKVWNYENFTTTFTDVNWVSNGWIEGSLKLSGAAKAYIDFNIFETDLRTTGKTIDFEFETHNVANLDSVLISCWTENKGIKITSTECIMASEQEVVRTRFKENERTRITITIESLNSHRMIKTYIDGVLSGIAQYSEQDNFQHNTPVGITINENGEEIDIRSIRIYNTALSNRAVLTNFIYDIQDITEKITKYNFNDIYAEDGSVHWGKMKSRIPIMYITGDLPTSKGAPTNVVIEYQNPFTPTDDFRYENCELDIQGTSSVYYPRKNYQIVFPERFSFYNGAVPEYEYTMKADYMETSHAHNTGNAIFVNTLYDELFPTQVEGTGVRNTIYGFPCVIYLRKDENMTYEYIGVYNFNNDKNSPATLGLTTDKAQSWEFKNNTSAHCLLRSDDFSAEAKPEENFEARYPKGLKDYSALQRVVSWIVSTENNLTKFRDEFEQYFNLHYCLIYYVMMDFGLLMDSRAKNMFFDTVDGLIWYPRFYDIDTAYGLNNEGVLDFGYGLEQTDENIYNGRNSLFWNNFQEVFMKDITDMYLSLRMSEKLSYDAALAVFEQHQRSQISEANYNEDAAWKYLTPLYETGDTTYLYVVQGSRIQHFKWWIANRIKYLDSKYEAPDFTKDFITMRLYTKDGNFKITPYIDTYVKCRFGSADVKLRAKAGEEIELNAPAGLEFNDTETIIFGGSNISSLGDLSSKYAGTVDIKAGTKLRELIIGSTAAGYSNPHLKILSLGSNDLLTKIDVSNCPNLTGSLDVSGCKKLQEFWGEGTSITGITFIDGGDLRELHLPSTITNLTIKNHINLTTVSPTIFDNLQTLVLKNSNLNATQLFFDNFNNFTRLYCEFSQEANTLLSKFLIDTLIKQCGGMDDNGLNTQYPNIQGYISLTYPSTMTEEKIAAMQNEHKRYFPDLHITYIPETVYYTYDTSNSRASLLTNVAYPETVSIPSIDLLEDNLGLPEGTVLSDSTCYLYNMSSGTTNRTNVKRLVVPSGYKTYDIRLCNFPVLEQIIWPRTPIKLEYFCLDNTTNSSTSTYTGLKTVDLSSELLDFTEVKTLNIQCYGVEEIIINNKTFNNITLANMIYGADGGGAKKLKKAILTNLSFPNATSLGNIIGPGGRYGNTTGFAAGGLLDLSGLNAPLVQTLEILYKHYGNIRTLIINNAYLPSLTSFNFNSYIYNNSGKQDLIHVELNDWITPSLTSLSNAFSGFVKAETIQFKNLNTASVTTMSGAFSSCSAVVELDVSTFLTDNVTNFSSMFSGCAKVELLDLRSFNTSLITTMENMFYNCYALNKIYYPSWDLSNCTNATQMFYNCQVLTDIDINTPIPVLETVNNMFYHCGTLTSINLSQWKENKLSTTSHLFDGCTQLTTINLDNLQTNSVLNMSYMFNSCSALSEINVLSFNTKTVTDMSYMFNGCSSLTNLDLSNFDLTNTLTLNHMFSGCTNLTTLNIDSFDTANVVDMTGLFNNCVSLPTATIEYFANELIDYSSATNVSEMFAGTQLTTFDTSRLNMDILTSVSGMFSGCKKLISIDLLPILNNKKITNISSLLKGCSSLRSLDFSNTDLTHISSADSCIANCTGLEEINLTNANMPSLGPTIWDALPTWNNMQSFDSSTANLSGKSWSVGAYYVKVETLTGVSIENLDLSGFNQMFAQCTASNFSFMRGHSVKHLTMCPVVLKDYGNYGGPTIANLFHGTTIESLTINPIEQTSTSIAGGFSGMTNLKVINGLENIPTYKMVNMSNLFKGCESLTSIELDKINTNACTNMEGMFESCKSLVNVDLTSFNTMLTTTMRYMFRYTRDLREVNFTGLNLAKLTNISYMFAESDIEDLDISTFNPTAATITTYMFNKCTKLKRLNLSGFTFAKNQSFANMFNNCTSLEYLDIRNWDVSKITTSTNYNSMFTYVPYDCTIVVKNETCRTWIKGKRSDFINVKLPSEL